MGAIWLMELTLSDLVNGSAFIRGDNMRCPFSLVVCCACNGHTLYCHLICSGDLLKKLKKKYITFCNSLRFSIVKQLILEMLFALS